MCSLKINFASTILALVSASLIIRTGYRNSENNHIGGQYIGCTDYQSTSKNN